MAKSIDKLDTLLSKISDWISSFIPVGRLNNDRGGRAWFIDLLEYTGKFKLEDLRKATDRGKLNSEYVERYKEKEPKSRKGISALKVEISALYSFNKCLVQRYKGRLHYYKDDLSQKGARNGPTIGLGYGLLKEFKKNLDA